MKSFKLSAVAALLASFTFAASAMTPVSDEALSQVSGQDGVSIVADLQVKIGSFTYTDSGNTFAMNDIGITGVLAATIDVIGSAEFKGLPTAANPTGTNLAAALLSSGVSAANLGQVMTDAASALGYHDQDVIAIAIPKVDNTTGLDITVASMTTGHGASGTNSMGSITLANLNLGGTKVWMFGHD